MTDDQSASLSWYRAPDFFFIVCQMWVSWCEAPSLTRGWVCNLLVQLLLGLARAVTLGSKSGRTHNHILPHWDSSNLEDQVPRIYIPQEQGGLLLPPGTGFPFRRHLRLAWLWWRYSNPPSSLFVASYNSKGYGGGILTSLHTAGLTDWSLITTALLVTFMQRPHRKYLFPFNYHNSGHYPSSCLLFKNTMFQDAIPELWLIIFIYHHLKPVDLIFSITAVFSYWSFNMLVCGAVT
jgi:hypothetical protein